MFNYNNGFNENLVINTLQFKLDCFDLISFREGFLGFFNNRPSKAGINSDCDKLGITYFMYILDSNGCLVLDAVVFEFSKHNLDGLIKYLYDKVCTKYLKCIKSNTFSIYIASDKLCALDFDIISINNSYSKV